jgi:uncharacterized protein (DUF924 family)
MSTLPDAARTVLDFWFGPPEDPAHRLARAQWFKKDDAFDADIRTRFGPLIEQALAGKLDAAWVSHPVQPLPALALVIVLDQFTRNTFRGTARAFAGDARALQVARALVVSGADRELTGVQRQFCYLPFEHAEDRSHQRTAVQLFEQLERDEPTLGGPTGLAHWARLHEDIVLKFGRFPHRNAALGRASTAQEAAFLLTPGSGF